MSEGMTYQVQTVKIRDYARECVAAAKAAGKDPAEVAQNYIQLAGYMLAVIAEDDEK